MCDDSYDDSSLDFLYKTVLVGVFLVDDSGKNQAVM